MRFNSVVTFRMAIGATINSRFANYYKQYVGFTDTAWLYNAGIHSETMFHAPWLDVYINIFVIMVDMIF